MFITPAHAHVLLEGEPGAHDGPMIILIVAVTVFLLFKLEKKWRQRSQRRNGEVADTAPSDEATTP